MDKLEEMLTQAESQEKSNEQWERLDRYETKEYYADEHGYTRISNKNIEDISENISVSGENNSQYIEFRMNRFYDGVDLSEMVISVFYEAEGVGDEGYVINAYRNSEELKFGWVIPSSVTQYHEIQLCIWVRGVLEDGSDYILKTLPKVYTIYPGLNIGGTVPEPEENWYLNFVRVMDSKVFEAKFLEDSCKEMNENVNAKSSQVDEQYLQIQIMHSEALEAAAQAEQYRDEAEQFRNEVFSATPDGYAELQETVASNTAKIDTIIEKAELNIKNSASGENLHLTDSAEARNVEFGLYGKAEQNGEPTPDNPIEITVSGSDGSVEVVICGKNLLKNLANSHVYNGITFTVNDDGSVTANGTSTVDIWVNLTGANSVKLDLDGNYILSGCPIGGSVSKYALTAVDRGTDDSKDVSVYRDEGKGVNVLFDSTHYYKIFIRVYSGATLNNLTFYPMIRLASDTDDTFEPYTETTSTIPTPDGLCGIKVSIGGNYTDENGQQWIADEIVKYADGSGKRIKRIGVIESYNNEEVTTGYMSTTGQLANGAKVIYILPTPIITDLNAEEIAEIEKLYTFYPVTNISNDADCGMSITYMADAKNYIDNRLALIESAIINNI